MHAKHLFIFMIIYTPFSFAMEDTSTPVRDVIPIICKQLNLSAVSKLLRTCKTYHDIYSKGVPKNFLDGYDQLTEKKLKTIQFGINRFLQQNPDHCYNLDSDQHTNILVHYAQTDNPTMIEHIITHENSDTRKNRITILEFFSYIAGFRIVTLLEDVFNIENNMQAYKAIAKCDSNMKHEDIFTACSYNSQIIKTFLLNGVDLATKNVEGMTPLHYVVSKNKYHTTQLLLAYNANINAKDKYNGTPLHTAARYGCNDAIIELLINAGANINAQDRGYNTPLHVALIHKHRSCIKMLLQHEADIALLGIWNFELYLDDYCIRNNSASYSALEIASTQGYYKDPEIGPLLEAADPSTGITRTIASFFRKL